MNSFTFVSPTKFIFGAKVTDEVGSHLVAAGYRRVLLAYGQGSVEKLGTLDRVRDSLNKAGVEFVELSGVRPNPEITSVREGLKAARDFGIDLVLALGGGSVIDCAKAIAVSYDYDGDPWDFSSKKTPITKALPVACVLTIPAAGSEASDSCVISNDELGMKSGMNSDLIRPAIAFMDPELTYTLPVYQTAAGITDMIAHILERYFSGVGAVSVTDNIATGLIRSIIDNSVTVLTNPLNYEARANIMWASTLAHNGIAGIGRGIGGRVGDWSSHGLEHELSALDTSITHGAGLAVIMPAWMRYVMPANPLRFATFARDVFNIFFDENNPASIEAAAKMGIDELQDYFTSMGMPATLQDLGLCEDDIERMIPTLIANKGEEFGSFMKLTADDARAIYRSAL